MGGLPSGSTEGMPLFTQEYQTLTGNNITNAKTLLALYGNQTTSKIEINTKLFNDTFSLLFNHTYKIIYDVNDGNVTGYSSVFDNYSDKWLTYKMEYDIIKNDITIEGVSVNA